MNYTCIRYMIKFLIKVVFNNRLTKYLRTEIPATVSLLRPGRGSPLRSLLPLSPPPSRSQ